MTRPASEVMREWEVVGKFYVVRGNKVRKFRVGDCCRISGSQDLWRIVGADANRHSLTVRVRLRHHREPRLSRVEDATRLRYVKPPYEV